MQNGDLTDSQVCHKVTVLATICSGSMSKMGGCSTYNVMCGDDSTIEQCSTHAALKKYVLPCASFPVCVSNAPVLCCIWHKLLSV